LKLDPEETIRVAKGKTEVIVKKYFYDILWLGDNAKNKLIKTFINLKKTLIIGNGRTFNYFG